jgi:hypothetical protein
MLRFFLWEGNAEIRHGDHEYSSLVRDCSHNSAKRSTGYLAAYRVGSIYPDFSE